MDRIREWVEHYNTLSKKPRRSYGGVAARNWDNPFETFEPYDVTEEVARKYHFYERRHVYERMMVAEAWKQAVIAQKYPNAPRKGYMLIKRDGKIGFYELHSQTEEQAVKDIVLFVGCFKIN